MSTTTQNNLRVSSIEGADVLLINGFEIHIVGTPTGLLYNIQRKELSLHTFTSLQEAVKWCEA